MIETILKTSLDTICATSKMIVDNLVKDEALSKAYVTLIDTQTEVAKKSVDAASEFSREFYSAVTKREFYFDLVKTMQEASKNFNFFAKK